MSLDNKAEAEIEIINRYLNKEINLLEKEMALNVILECNNYILSKTCKEIELFKKLTLDYSTTMLIDLIINFGRDSFNSDKLNDNKIEELTLLALEQRKRYEI